MVEQVRHSIEFGAWGFLKALVEDVCMGDDFEVWQITLLFYKIATAFSFT